jgi:threonine efflux protein
MYVELLLSLLAVDLLAAMSPGPNFVLVTQTAIQQSSRRAMAVVAGFVVSNVTWCIAVVLGLSALFRAVPWLYGAIRVCGGAYLIWLGISAWRTNGKGSPDAGRRTQATSSFVRGLLTTFTNPKSAVYFGSVFTLFMKPGTPLWVQMAAMAIVVVDSILWYGAVALLFSHGAVRRRYTSMRHWIDRMAGAVMIAFGIRLITERT